MSLKSLVRVLVSVLAALALSSPVMAKDHCSAAKTKAECGKKTACAWTKSCVAKTGGAGTVKAGTKATTKAAAKPAKGKAATAAKPAAKPAAKAAAKKPAAAPAPAPEEATDDAVPSEDTEMEDMSGEEEDF